MKGFKNSDFIILGDLNCGTQNSNVESGRYTSSRISMDKGING